MAIVTKRNEVLAIYAEAAKNRWVLPCFCSENLTTTEAILAAAREYGEGHGVADTPIIVAITCQYGHRTQAAYYTHTRRWDTGLKLFLADLRVLTEADGPYSKLRVMVHLDHVQPDDDAELLTWDMGAFSSIMFDASKFPFDENIRMTGKFVKERGRNILVEGACDEIVDATGKVKSELTDSEKAEKYFRGTGADLIVANLGTEHRASAKDLNYYGDYARRIRDRIGTKIVLHGASSVPSDQIAGLIDDGVCKVNIWTALERDSSPLLFRDLVENASKVAGAGTVEALKREGLLGPNCRSDEAASISHFTTVHRQDLVFREMKKIVGGYLDLWYR
jgi:fructose/tagatose bisphosphate aldolase